MAKFIKDRMGFFETDLYQRGLPKAVGGSQHPPVREVDLDIVVSLVAGTSPEMA